MIKFNCEHGKPSYATCQECVPVDLAGTGEPFVIETTGDAMKVMESMTTKEKKIIAGLTHQAGDANGSTTSAPQHPTKDWEWEEYKDFMVFHLPVQDVEIVRIEYKDRETGE